MKKPGFSQKITIAACFILVLGLFFFSLVNYFRMQSQTHQDLQQEIAATSEAATANISNWLNGKIDLVKAVADQVEQSSDPQTITNQLTLARNGGAFNNVYYGQENGAFLIDDPSIELPDDYDARTRPWFKLGRKGSPAFTEPYADASTSQLLITGVAPMASGGVAGGDLPLTVISDVVNQTTFRGLGRAYLINAKGKVLAHPEKEKANTQIEDIYEESGIKINESLQPASLEGKQLLVGFFPITGVPSVEWFLAVEIDVDMAFAPLKAFRNTAIFMTLIGIFITVIVLTILLSRLTAPLVTLQRAMDDIASGEADLTRRLTVTGEDEIGKLATSFNTFVGNIHGLIEDFKGSSENLATMVSNMSKAAAQSSHEMEDQRSETEMVAAAVSEMSSAAGEIAQNAQQAAQAAQDADQEGLVVGETVQSAISSIQTLANEIERATQVIGELENEVSSISSVLEVIRGIAEQTNLLALNAAIEAARAGEQGRGFAVVADEVRSLAGKTQDSTEEINSTIERLQKGAHSAVEVMANSQKVSIDTVSKAGSAGESLERIASAVSTISDMNIQIAAASEEQTAVIEDISRNVTNISDATERTAQAAVETANTSETLAEIGQSIKEKVNRFKV